jgi:mRNA-degrading endonuclease toxin of MazEF toxin-antitoxin module
MATTSSQFSRPALRYGRLVWARIADRNGYEKERPAIIVTPTAQISSSEPVLLVAVTTTFPDPPPASHVPLPWNSDPRRVATLLARRSAAVVEWLATVRLADILEVKGDVPAKQMRIIQHLLDARI